MIGYSTAGQVSDRVLLSTRWEWSVVGFTSISLRSCLFILGWAVVLLLPRTVLAEDLVDALAHLTAETRVEREITLRDLGFDQPELLASSDQRRLLFFPVPAGLPLLDATLHFDAEYLRGDGGRTTLVLSIDTYPVSARALTGDQGDAGLVLGVDGSPRASGFVNLGVAWSSIVATTLCEDQRSIGNSLAILPSTRLRFGFEGAEIQDLTTAWSALPPRPRILLPPAPVDAQSYDAAWRLGLALSKAGKTALFQHLPGIGEEVMLDAVEVPASLLAVPAFAALAGGGAHRLANQAELGALLILMPELLRADILIADETLSGAIGEALAALQQEVISQVPAASGALAIWQERVFPDAHYAVGSGTIALTRFGAQRVMVVRSGAGAEAAEVLTDTWRRMLLVHSVHARQVDRPPIQAAQVSLDELGMATGALDVMARGDWTLGFDLSRVSTEGRLPVEARIEVAAAPGPGLTKPIVSVYLNDYLLGARRLDAHGRAETIRAPIPLYALSPRNLLRVTFQRQPFSDLCREEVQAYPVAVLPSSQIRFGQPRTSDSFIGVLPSLAQQASLIVPPDYLEHASLNLPLVVRLAEASGLSPLRTRLQVTPPGGVAVNPEAAFLAFDVELGQARPKARLEGTRLVLSRMVGSPPYFDLAGLDRIGMVQVLRAGSTTGLLWQRIGQDLTVPDQPFLLTRGDIAILGSQGPLVLIDSTQADSGMIKSLGETLTTDLPLSLQGQDARWVYTALIILALFGLLIFAAYLARRRARGRKSESG